MRALLWMCVPVFAVGCSAPRTVPRAPIVPPNDIAAPNVKPDVRLRADADKSAPLPMQEPEVGDVSVQDRVITQTVEVPVPAPAPTPYAPAADYGHVDDYYPAVFPAPRYRYRYSRRPRFPINTVIGAGVGAIIGHQHGRRRRGALIGSGIGLMFDLRRRR